MVEATVPRNQVTRVWLRQLLHDACVDLSTLNSFCRVLLTTDGTLTEILEAYFLEQIHLLKVSETLQPAKYANLALKIQPGEEIIERKIILQGLSSGVNYVYAESIIVVNELEASMRADLLGSKTPIGRLWIEHKMETFKEMISMRRQPAGDLAPLFDVAADSSVLSRAYRVFSRRKPIIMIVETFPEHLSCDHSHE
jgi:chorismate-pyruvate lyase